MAGLWLAMVWAKTIYLYIPHQFPISMTQKKGTPVQENDTPVRKGMTRGEFLKKAAIATAGFYIVPRHVLGGKGYLAPSDKLYIAAVGCGGEAENDIHHYATAPKKNAEIAFLCDVDDRTGSQ